MGGFIIFGDGRAWAPSNTIYDHAIERIANNLRENRVGHHSLADWLLMQRSIVRGPGLGRIDLRELTHDSQQLILEAMVTTFPAVAHAELQPIGPGLKLSDPIDWMAIDRYQLLGHMVAAYLNGEPPMSLNPMMKEVLSPTGRRSGPGWDQNHSP